MTVVGAASAAVKRRKEKAALVNFMFSNLIRKLGACSAHTSEGATTSYNLTISLRVEKYGMRVAPNFPGYAGTWFTYTTLYPFEEDLQAVNTNQGVKLPFQNFTP